MTKKELIEYINKYLPSPLFYFDKKGNVKFIAKEIMKKGKPEKYTSQS